MLIVKFNQKYKHTERRTWEAGDTPVLDRVLALELIEQGVAVLLGPGCGCPGLDLDTLASANLAAMKAPVDEPDQEEEIDTEI
jgi:hypothetical protein